MDAIGPMLPGSPDMPTTVAQNRWDQLWTVAFTILVIFAIQGFLSMLRGQPRQRDEPGSVDQSSKSEPTPTPPTPSEAPQLPAQTTATVDKTTIVVSPSSGTVTGDGSDTQASADSQPATGTTAPAKPKADATGTVGKAGGDASVTQPPSKDTAIPKDGQPSTTSVPKSLGPPGSGAAGAPPPKSTGPQPITAQKLLDDMHAVHGDVRLSQGDIKLLLSTLAEVKSSVAELSEISKRVAAIEKLIGVFAGKMGPMGANVDTTQKAVDQGFKENVRLLSTISANVRGHREDAQQEAKDFHSEQGQWLSATEAKLVDGIKEVLKKITNTDFNSSQVYNQKLEGIEPEILAALNFTQNEVAELKTTLGQTSETVHSIKEMCERPVVSSHPPSYRAPVFQGHHDIPPAPPYDAHVRPRVNLQQALPLASPHGITVSPDGGSLNIPLR
ncbi:unnamed protein product [Symbiodinium sp. CCMP2592]|nr:unnamed protein product [Symbiodinium sp. CCMP2592]